MARSLSETGASATPCNAGGVTTELTARTWQSSVAGVMSWSSTAPRATAWVSSAGVIGVTWRPGHRISRTLVSQWRRCCRGRSYPESTCSWARSSAALATQTWRQRESTSHFQIVVRTFTEITDSGHPCKIPLVALHHAPQHHSESKER